MNRIDRLTAILTHLQSKRLTKAQEIADRFEISLRTVYRDIRALEEGGVPVIGEAGQGYSLMEGYRLPPVMFTAEEAQSLALAEKIIGQISDRSSLEHFQSAMLKIKSVLRATEKEKVQQLSSLVAVFNQKNQLLHDNKDRFLQQILEALVSRKLIDITYTTFLEEKTSHRTLEAVGVYYAYQQWYLIAWCRMRADYRTFRLDRINTLTVLDENYNPQSHPSLSEYLEKIRSSENLLEIVISIPISAEKYLRVQKFNQGFVLERREKDRVLMTFMCTSLEGFIRWIICLGDKIQIISPLEAQQRLRDLTREIWKKQNISAHESDR